MIDTESEPGAWARAFDRGCLSETIARCKACDDPDCAHPDPIYLGIVPAGEPAVNSTRDHGEGASL